MKRKFQLAACLSGLIVTSTILSACGNVNQNYKILANYNGQADLLLSLQIPPDYYPYQYQENKLRDYLINSQNYVITDANTSTAKANFKEQIQKRFAELLKNVKTYGPSLWNNAIYEGGIVSRNLEAWTNKNVDLMFMERFVLDDYPTVGKASGILPNYQHLVQTNFRASRDPFTTFGKDVYQAVGNNSQTNSMSNEAVKLANGLKKHAKDIQKKPNGSEYIDGLYRYDSYINFWNRIIVKNQSDLEKAGFNHWLANNGLSSSQGSTTKHFTPVFYLGNQDNDNKLAKLYQQVILSKKETSNLNKWIQNSQNQKSSDSNSKSWQLNYLRFSSPSKTVSDHSNNTSQLKKQAWMRKILQHHPAFEQQKQPGSSPAAEGSQRDTMVYLYQLANGLNQYIKQSNTDFKASFQSDWRYNHMQNALHNVSLISSNLKTRLTNIRKYLQAINVVDSKYNPENNCFTNDSSKTVSIVTFPPSNGGGGNATIQTISKFGFLYHDLGLKQVLPVNHKNNTKTTMNLDFNAADGVKYAGQNSRASEEKLGDELFNIDDNGWWWNLGNTNVNTSNFEHFQNTSDTVIITATDADWNKISGSSSGDIATAKTLATIAKDVELNSSTVNPRLIDPKIAKIVQVLKNKNSVSRVEYGLWNEGLRSPFSVNMVLDQLVKILQNQYDSNSAHKDMYAKAMDWGKYWEDNFINNQDQTSYVALTKQSEAPKS